MRASISPRPSSQIACTIGGNVGENSGGVHCLKYGLTTNNVLGVELVLISGEIIRLGGKHLDAGALDLLSVIIGSEGLLGVVTEVTCACSQEQTRRVPCWWAFPPRKMRANAWPAPSPPASFPPPSR